PPPPTRAAVDPLPLSPASVYPGLKPGTRSPTGAPLASARNAGSPAPRPSTACPWRRRAGTEGQPLPPP
ncbi:wd repeat-containing protein 3, partial [Nannochloropsis gaditana CCMP526]|uniref:wd repeat-containing protein 3 n=1 Tax=Nannochloropsis gaditana (strain CCMP526) TaxID=1093141 RepID=UPI00029F6650